MRALRLTLPPLLVLIWVAVYDVGCLLTPCRSQSFCFLFATGNVVWLVPLQASFTPKSRFWRQSADPLLSTCVVGCFVFHSAPPLPSALDEL